MPRCFVRGRFPESTLSAWRSRAAPGARHRFHQLGQKLGDPADLSISIKQLPPVRHRRLLVADLLWRDLLHQPRQRAEITLIPRRLSRQTPPPVPIEVVGQRDLAGDDRKGGAQVLAQLDRVAKTSDAVAALRQTPDVYRREVIGDLLARHPAGEQDRFSQLAAGGAL